MVVVYGCQPVSQMLLPEVKKSVGLFPIERNNISNFEPCARDEVFVNRKL